MKKKWFSRILSLMLVAVMLLPNFNMVAYGAETPDFDVMNVQLEEQQGSEETEITADGMVLSYKDAPYVDTSFADEVKSGTDPVRGVQPTSYSSSSYLPAYTSSNYMSFEQQANIVTPVKDQNPYGTCWSHAAMSVAETNYIKTYGLASNAVDFNEYQHVWYAYNPVKDELGLYGGDYNAKNPRYGYTSILDLGGNNLISMMMLANWTGASNASESVFDSDDVLYGNKPVDSFAYDDIAHLENAYVLTIPNVDYYSSYADMQVDMNIVKQAIRDYGSVTVSYAYTDDYRYNSETFQCINIPNYLEDEGTNHAVTIVGWNDNVPASAFPNGADGNGAWLVKNSWDTWYGYDGYFWLSYYDRSIGMNAVAMDFASADNYDNNYHYDGSGNYTGYVYYGGYDYIYGGNAYVADSAETLEAVGLTTYDVNYNYTIYVYKNVPAGAVPTAGALVTTQSGTLAYAGFHTIDLNQSVSLDAGERYGIVVCFEKPGYQALLCTDMSYSWGWVDFYSYAKAGESYIGLSLSSMEDMNPDNSYYEDGYNVRIKAFTNEGQGGSHAGGWQNDGYGWKYQKEDGAYVTNCWYQIDGQWYAFDAYSYMREGWFYDGAWYFLRYGSGIMATGWVNDGGTWYYMNPSGAMATGWIWDGAWYYMYGSGAMATGWVNDGGAWYYMNPSGIMATGWVNDGGTWYYMNPSGIMATGWVFDGGCWYYMNPSGAMATGWVFDGGNWYYMYGSGVMATGWIQDGGNWYYLYDNGVMARDTWIGDDYVDDSGVWRP